MIGQYGDGGVLLPAPKIPAVVNRSSEPIMVSKPACPAVLLQWVKVFKEEHGGKVPTREDMPLYLCKSFASVTQLVKSISTFSSRSYGERLTLNLMQVMCITTGC
jgi:hypothetical protein